MGQLSDSSFVCSYKCEITFAGLKAYCPQSQSIISALPLNSDDVNPYIEFKSMIDLLNQIDSSKPFPLIFSFKSCEKTCNAASVTIGTEQYIYYNQTFLNGIKGATDKQRWAIRCIIAHEIGHHLLGHTSPDYRPESLEEQRKNELRADHFSAFVIQHYPGATLDNAYEGLNTLSNYDPKTVEEEEYYAYPTLSRRYDAVKEGFTVLDKPVMLRLYAKIDSVAKIYVEKFGKSILLNVFNESMMGNDFNKAEQALKEIKTQDPEFFKRNNLQETEKLIQKQRKLIEKNDVQNVDKLSPSAKQNLRDLQIKYLDKNAKRFLKDETINGQLELEKIKSKIQDIQSEMKLDNAPTDII